MTESEYTQFTKKAKSGIKGEAFFESLISEYSLPHHVVGLKDLGIDYICEWVYGDRPTGILYAVQVKTFLAENVKVTYLGSNPGMNELSRYRITNNLLVFKKKTLEYWRGLGIPLYLFVIVDSRADRQGSKFDCFYRRFTATLTAKTSHEDQEDFYKVNDGMSFLAFGPAHLDTGESGFARDLFVDFMRCSYSRGSISFLSPSVLGLQGDEETVFDFLFEEYGEIIRATYEKTGEYLSGVRLAKPSHSGFPGE